MHPSLIRILAPLGAALVLGTTAQAQTMIGGKVQPSFPIIISQPGSYMLAGNLNVPAGVGAIGITAAGVTLDLNGYTISGPVNCPSRGNCTLVGNPAVGVASTMPNTVIRNGTIRGFNGNGLTIAGMSTLENLTVRENGGIGIVGGNQAMGTNLLRNVQVALNKSHGIYLFESILRDCAAAENGGAGFYVNFATVIDSAVTANGQQGMFGGSHVMVRGTRGSNNLQLNFDGNLSSAGGNMNDWTMF